MQNEQKQRLQRQAHEQYFRRMDAIKAGDTRPAELPIVFKERFLRSLKDDRAFRSAVLDVLLMELGLSREIDFLPHVTKFRAQLQPGEKIEPGELVMLPRDNGATTARQLARHFRRSVPKANRIAVF